MCCFDTLTFFLLRNPTRDGCPGVHARGPGTHALPRSAAAMPVGGPHQHLHPGCLHSHGALRYQPFGRLVSVLSQIIWSHLGIMRIYIN